MFASKCSFSRTRVWRVHQKQPNQMNLVVIRFYLYIYVARFQTVNLEQDVFQIFDVFLSFEFWSYVYMVHDWTLLLQKIKDNSIFHDVTPLMFFTCCVHFHLSNSLPLIVCLFLEVWELLVILMCLKNTERQSLLRLWVHLVFECLWLDNSTEMSVLH